jgi:2-keto-4-pentenoate hydratase/2-oxohepta-3-ene-1,7-dioic acid hydratase in catechol pathway
MRWISYQADSGPRSALSTDRGYVDPTSVDSSLPTSLKLLMTAGPAVMAMAAAAAQEGPALPSETLKLLPPIIDPQKIICIGLNYADHARETGAEIPTEPVVFNKFPTALRAHEEAIELPAVSSKVDYEAELVVVIGRQARFVDEHDALAYVGGYTCGHDVSARDWQKGKPGGQWLLGKSFDSFAPCGPELVTPDEVGDPGDLRVVFRLNGETLQDSSTDQLIFCVPQLIAYLSGVCTLMPGDLIFTGTPPGVGAARKPPVFLKPGDIAEVEIEGIGLLRNPVMAAANLP